MKLLSREMLTDAQWAVLRDAPQLVIQAISASGGSPLDSLLERKAGAKAIEDGRNNDHPLIRALALPGEIDAALSNIAARTQAGVAATATTTDGPDELVRSATEAVAQAAEVLRSVGGDLDLYAYREFVLGVARVVAEAAREGDFIGLGGHRVSDAERAVIASLSRALSS
jgi:hypothetical protein